MQKPSFNDSSLASEDFLEDDIDQLFGKMQPLMAPEDLMQRVLESLKQKQFPLYDQATSETNDNNSSLSL